MIELNDEVLVLLGEVYDILKGGVLPERHIFFATAKLPTRLEINKQFKNWNNFSNAYLKYSILKKKEEDLKEAEKLKSLEALKKEASSKVERKVK
jgi:hypothetical protein